MSVFGNGRSRILFLGLFGLVAASAIAWAGLGQKAAEPATIHPQRSIVYVHWDGMDRHEAAYQETAQYKALVESGLQDYIVSVVRKLMSSGISRLGGPFRGAPNGDQAEKLFSVFSELDQVNRNGFSLSITDGLEDGPPMPLATLVVNNMAGYEQQVAMLLRAAGLRAQPESETILGRSVQSLVLPDTPGMEIGWWSEGGHLVVAFGISPVLRVLETVDGKLPTSPAANCGNAITTGKSIFRWPVWAGWISDR
ncbi:MAG: hypothetical protein R3C49_17360 [Planctomycetaceae bacterium]